MHPVSLLSGLLMGAGAAATALAAPIATTATAGALVHTIPRAGFAGVTMDWWPPGGGCHDCDGGWQNASVTHADFSSARLRALAAALAPGVLRLGGTLDKVIQYWLPDEHGAATPAPPACRPNPGNFSGAEASYLCLNATRWAEVNEFAEATGLRLVFGLSLNATQNQRMLRHNHAQNYSILAYEIPEEFTPGWHGYPGSDGTWAGFDESYDCDWDCYIGMFHSTSATLHALYDAEQASGGRARPLLTGPSEGMVGWKSAGHTAFTNFTTQWVRKVVAATAGVLDALVYHSYNNDAIASEGSATFFLNQTMVQGAAYLAEAALATPKPLPVILGEGAFHNGGCSVGGCDTFGSSVYYLDALSKLAAMGYVKFRQYFLYLTLWGGCFELDVRGHT